MFEQHSFVRDDSNDQEVELAALDSQQIPPASALAAPGNPGFQLPRGVWIAMLGCYAVFLAAVLLATRGSREALFAIVISALYTLVYFGVARIGARQAGAEDPSPLTRGKPLATWTGPMDAKAVYGQVLIAPLAVALFGIAVLAITIFVT